MPHIIFKYPLTNDLTTLDLPLRAKVLSVHAQDNKPFIWAQVDKYETRTTRRTFIAVPTGWTIPDPNPTSLIFIGTILSQHDAYVTHIFEAETQP